MNYGRIDTGASAGKRKAEDMDHALRLSRCPTRNECTCSPRIRTAGSRTSRVMCQATPDWKGELQNTCGSYLLASSTTTLETTESLHLLDPSGTDCHFQEYVKAGSPKSAR
jgi:hypothetical protein